MIARLFRRTPALNPLAAQHADVSCQLEAARAEIADTHMVLDGVGVGGCRTDLSARALLVVGDIERLRAELVETQRERDDAVRLNGKQFLEKLDAIGAQLDAENAALKARRTGEPAEAQPIGRAA